MVRGILITMALLSLFLMNACGNNNLQKPANIDNSDAVQFKTGKSRGQGKDIVVKEYNANDELVEKVSEPIFSERPNFEIDWDAKTISMTGKLIVYAGGKEKLEDVEYVGSFDEYGYATLKPKNGKIVSLAVARCVDLCDSVVTDVRFNEVINGEIKKKSQQFEYIDTARMKNKAGVKSEVDPSKSELAEEMVVQADAEKPGSAKKDADAKAGKPGKDKKDSKKEVKKEEIPVAVAPSEDIEEDEADEGEELAEFEIDEPGTPTTFPFLITDEMLENRDKTNINVQSFQSSGIFPINLGAAYSGKAQGYYSRGTIAKATEVPESKTGFKSISRADKIYYGSGLMIKTIEEAGKLFAKFIPSGFFEVNDISKKAGGRAKPHASHQNGLDADIRVAKFSNGKVDHAKTWALVKSFVNIGYVDIIIWSPTLMNEMCTYLKSSGEKGYTDTFSKFYKDTAKKRKNKKGKVYYTYGHTGHIHVRLQCTPHNAGCKSATYMQSKRGVCQ